MHATQPASGKITNADTVTIDVVEPPDLSPGIRGRRTEKPSIITRTRRRPMWPPGIIQTLAATVDRTSRHSSLEKL